MMKYINGIFYSEALLSVVLLKKRVIISLKFNTTITIIQLKTERSLIIILTRR
jgi:hypothetical protein